jgi:hypothetical protein
VWTFFLLSFFVWQKGFINANGVDKPGVLVPAQKSGIRDFVSELDTIDFAVRLKQPLKLFTLL